MEYQNQPSKNTFSKKTWGVILIVGLIGLVLLLRNHTSHLLIALPYLVLLACPLMYLFMHKGHGDHDQSK